VAFSIGHVLHSVHTGSRATLFDPEMLLVYPGMVTSIGVRQISHFRRKNSDLVRLPLFVLQLTLVMVPVRIIAFATMFQQGWGTRAPFMRGSLRETACAESGHG
jgi:hypothetical protein